jgi:hypothetical protein
MATRSFRSGDAASVSWNFTSNGYLVMYNDGTAHLYGDVVNSSIQTKVSTLICGSKTLQTGLHGLLWVVLIKMI